MLRWLLLRSTQVLGAQVELERMCYLHDALVIVHVSVAFAYHCQLELSIADDDYLTRMHNPAYILCCNCTQGAESPKRTGQTAISILLRLGEGLAAAHTLQNP